MSCRQHRYPWPSLATSPYYSSPLAGLQGYILCPHIAAVCKFELVVLLLLGHIWGSIGVQSRYSYLIILFVWTQLYSFKYSCLILIIVIIIIIIMLCWQHGSPWLSLTTHLYRPSLLGGLPHYILYQHRAVEYRFWLVILLLLVYVKGSTGIYHLWVH